MDKLIKSESWWIEDTTSHANYKDCNKESGTSGLANPCFGSGGFDLYTKWHTLIVIDTWNYTIVRSCKLIHMSTNHSEWLNEDNRVVVSEVKNTASFVAYQAKVDFYHYDGKIHIPPAERQKKRYLIMVT